MHRIDGAGYALGNQFTEGDPMIPTPATVITDDWLNAVQEELAAVVEGSGAALNKPDNTQLLVAMRTLFGFRADVTLTAAQVKTLNATPFQLVAPPGANKALILLGANLYMPYATTPYNLIAVGDDLAIKYTGSAGLQVAQVEATGLFDQTASQQRWVYPVTTADIKPVANAPLMLHMLNSEIAAGDSPLKVRTYYRIIDTSW